MSTLKKIDDAYNMYILCDKNIKRTTDITTLSGVTLRKYVKIKESLDFELTEFLDKKGKLKLTISDALKLCEKVINPEYQYLIFDKFINSPKKDRFRLLSEECTCMICAEESVNFEFTPCCHNPICETCLVKTFECVINDKVFKGVNCPFCNVSFPLLYCSWFLIDRVRSYWNEGKNINYNSESLGDLWRNTRDYNKLNHYQLSYMRNLHNKYMKTIQVIQNNKKINLDLKEPKFDELLGDEKYYSACTECTPKFTKDSLLILKRDWRYLQVCDIPKECGNGEGEILVIEPEMFRCVVCKSRDEDLNNGEFKKCPHCGIKTVKPDGCNYIYCGDHRWCWICNERIENNSNGHNKHYWTGPGTSPYTNRCRESINHPADKYIIHGKCNCSGCRDFGGAPLCKTLDCMKRTFVKYLADGNDMFNDYCIDCHNHN
jgi:hypothetical protein